jgi:hypothetical protein
MTYGHLLAGLVVVVVVFWYLFLEEYRPNDPQIEAHQARERTI